MKRHCWNCGACDYCREGCKVLSIPFPVRKKCYQHYFRHEIQIKMAMDTIFNPQKDLGDWF
jgi:hypothetical protein